MKKLLLSVAILVGATFILSLDNDSDNMKDVVKEDVISIQSKLQAES